MSRNRIFMNETLPAAPRERWLYEQADRYCGIRPLDGTNIGKWIYKRKDLENACAIMNIRVKASHERAKLKVSGD